MNKPRTKNRILEKIKTGIDLVEYAMSQGYKINKKKSSLSSVHLERGKGDIIIVAKDSDNHFIYFNPLNHLDSGSILDFVMNKKNYSLWQAKDDLKRLIGETLDIPKDQFIPKITKSSKNKIEVLKKYSQLTDLVETSKGCEYLKKARRLERKNYLTGRFQGKIKTDHYNAVIFPHFDENGVIGWEAKNWNFTGFPSGSDKGIWASNRRESDNKLVITESGIDCLSYYTLEKDETTWFISTAGGWSPITEKMIIYAVTKVHPGNEVILAFDNDEAGDLYRKKSRDLLKDSKKMIFVDIPKNKDWNEDLINKCNI